MFFWGFLLIVLGFFIVNVLDMGVFDLLTSKIENIAH
jgi:hypothetical protein